MTVLVQKALMQYLKGIYLNTFVQIGQSICIVHLLRYMRMKKLVQQRETKDKSLMQKPNYFQQG